MAKDLLNIGDDYNHFLQSLKERIHQAQVKAAMSVNRELVLLYWQIGKEILERQKQQGWGSKVVTQLAKDLKRSFPDMKGFSRTNLLYMRSFAEAFPEMSIVQEVLGQIPWYHNIALMDKLKHREERLWYARKTAENGWSRNVLVMQIESHLYQRQGGAVTNFERTLPRPQSDLAQNLLKDPYNFDFLGLGEEAQERDLEKALVGHIRDFLLELGIGFSFVGSQYPLQVGSKEYRVDLLFYHFRLRCFVVIDLKMGEFEPEFSGKMNFYVSAVDELLRHPDDQPTIGIILCKDKDRTVAEYALRDVNKPISVSTHQFGRELPEDLQTSLPSVEQLEMELNMVVAEVKQETPENLTDK